MDFFAALEAEVRDHALDFRTRLLVRDGLCALEDRWGRDKLHQQLVRSPAQARLEEIWQEDLGPPGFPFLSNQLMDSTKPETVRQFFRELANHLDKPVSLYVGGSVALLLPELLHRNTQDIDIVDEVPAEIRNLHRQLDQLMQRYRLQLTHFQSHFLPTCWQNRVHSLEPFGKLQVYLVDVYDVFLSKLFSGREKDRDDLRALVPQLIKANIVEKLKNNTASLQSDVKLKKRAEDNWFILYGEALPQ